MKLEMNKAIAGLDGRQLQNEGVGMDLRSVVQSSLLAEIEGDRELDGQAKAKLWRLALDANNDSVEWPVEDVALVKGRIGKGYGPLVVGPAFQLLDGGD